MDRLSTIEYRVTQKYRFVKYFLLSLCCLYIPMVYSPYKALTGLVICLHVLGHLNASSAV